VEVFPVVLLEAMAFGCAVISTDVGEVPDITIESSVCLVKPGETVAIRKAISALIESPSKCLKMGAQNQSLAEKYDIDTVSMSFVRQLYCSIEKNA